MSTFQFTELAPLPPGAIEAACLGVDGTAPNRLSTKDINKAVKLGPLDNYVLCAAGDEFEGVVSSVEFSTMNSGFSFGGVQRKFNGGVIAMNTNAVVLAVGDLIVADAQAAIGTTQTVPNIKKGVPTKFLWRVKSLLGNAGAQNKTVLIERI